MSAFLVIREGHTWRDVYRLIPGQLMSVGRAATNRLVVQDEICSRQHCELFCSGETWLLRDLDSRNGTKVNGRLISGDCLLQPGALIQIGQTILAYTHDVAEFLAHQDEFKFSDGETDVRKGSRGGKNMNDSGFIPEIVERKSITRFNERQPSPTWARDRVSQSLARLYRLTIDMGNAPDSRNLGETVLDGLFSAIAADIGGILLLPDALDEGQTIDPSRLAVLAYKTRGQSQYERLSKHLSRTVLATRDAVLARCVPDDPALCQRDSLGRLQAQSVICAPIRVNERLLGLIHLYSTDPENSLDPEDLEFTLAVADQFAIALDALQKREHLAANVARMHDENQSLRQQLGIESELVGSSDSLNEINRLISKIAPTSATVLIRGESGVGKELVARAIHFNSSRRGGPFVCMNCAALSESLLESELFGHEKGSFTGAASRKAGKFEQAHTGTLMLDEVGEMSLAIQAKFLRVLEGHPYERVGGVTPVQVDVRVVAATNRDLEKAVEEGTFRKDLYFRLHVVEIMVPPLRERLSDVPTLANHFLERVNRKSGCSVKGFTPQALERLSNYDWPGNVRELQNVVERAVILCPGEQVGVNDIQLTSLGSQDFTPPASESPASGAAALIPQRDITLDELEQEYILVVLDRTNWNKSQAAQILGIERSTLDRKLKRYQVERTKN